MLLTVIVTIVDGGATLERCLEGLAAQEDAPALQVLIPYDDSVAGIAHLRGRFPGFTFLPLGQLPTARPPASHPGQHELFDRRRAAGLAAAAGHLVALLEDRGVPRPDWARQMASLHEQLPHAVIGGAIENARDTIRHWAVYFCDFGRFGRPFAAGPRAWVSDINIAYKRAALDRTSSLWRERYHETTVHWALLRAGETLYLSPQPVVDQQRGPLRVADLIRERFAWGRLFAATRAEETSRAKRWAYAVGTPALPVLLFIRHARLQLARRPRVFCTAVPLLVVLLVAWSAGEAVGYLTARS